MKVQKKIPVLVLAYSRPSHFSKTLEMLHKQEDVESHDIYIFIDGLPERASKELQDQHQKVLDIATSFHTGGRVVLHTAKSNLGVFAAATEGIRIVLEEHDAFLYLEEDILVYPDYLAFMNQALLYYQDRPEVYAINGFCFGEIAPLVPQEGFFSYRFCPWGFGTWKDRWESVDLQNFRLGWRKFSPFFWWRFNKDSWGWGLVLFLYTFFPFLRKAIQPWDVLFCLHHYLKKHVAYFPPKSLVRNGGLDDSGLHSKIPLLQEESLFQNSVKKNICFSETVQVNLKLHSRMARYIIPVFRRKTIRSGYLWLKRKGAFWSKGNIL